MVVGERLAGGSRVSRRATSSGQVGELVGGLLCVIHDVLSDGAY